jgi:hypothetical protein
MYHTQIYIWQFLISSWSTKNVVVDLDTFWCYRDEYRIWIDELHQGFIFEVDDLLAQQGVC